MNSSENVNRSPALPSQVLVETTANESRAERLLAEYLRVWGLRDPQVIARLSRQWVRSAISTQVASGQNMSLNELYRAVIVRASADMEQWIGRLADQVTDGAGDARSRRGLLAFGLQNVLDDFSAALLDEQSFPPALVEHLAGAAQPVVPATCLVRMPTQSLELLSPARYFARWRRGWFRLWRRPRSSSDPAAAAVD